ncbi:hypothetical protein Peur_002861 [Populus x canadensis]
MKHCRILRWDNAICKKGRESCRVESHLNKYTSLSSSAVQLVAAMPNENTSLFLPAAYSVAVVRECETGCVDDGHSLCTLAKQESVERDLTPDIPEPIIVPFL